MDDEGNPRDTAAPDSSPRPEPPPPPLDEPDPEARPADRLSKQVPLGLLFFAAVAAVLIFLVIVAVIGVFALSPDR